MVLQPDESMVVIAHSQMSTTGVKKKRNSYKMRCTFIEAAKIASIPVLHIAPVVTNAQIGRKSAVGSRGLPQTFPFDPKQTNISDSDLGRALAGLDRSKIVIMGPFQEEATTLLALRSLAVGFDVFVVDDTAQIKNKHKADLVRSRLSQAGAVVLQLEQVVREWASLSTNTKIRDELLKLLERTGR